MIVNEEFLSKLRRSFNLNLYEVKLWTALLSRGISTAGELSDIAGVPRSRTYDVLESLERKGFVVVKPEKPIKYMAISPQEVLDRVKRRLTERAQEQSTRLEDLKNSDVLTELGSLYTEGIEPMQPTDFSGALKGRHNLYDHLSMLIKEAEKSVSIITSEEGFIRKVRSLRPLLERAKSRGVNIKIAAPISDTNKEAAERLANIAEVRNVSEFPARFCVVDSKQMMFMLLDDKEVHPSYDLGLWVNTPYFSTALQGMFDKVWTNGNTVVSAGEPVKAEEPAPAPTPEPEEAPAEEKKE